MSVLGGLASKWYSVGLLLDLPDSALSAIKSENTEDLVRLRMCIICWLQMDPDASWRKLIYELNCSSDPILQRTANTIRKYAEKLSGRSVHVTMASCMHTCNGQMYSRDTVVHCL